MSSNLPINKQIEKYIDEHSLKLHPVQDEIIKHNDTLGKKKKLQISINQCHFLYLVTKLFKPKEILEIGTFTGLSSLSMCIGLENDSKITTIDKNKDTSLKAKNFFEKAKVSEKIDIIIDEAINGINKLISQKKLFDLIFIDANGVINQVVTRDDCGSLKETHSSAPIMAVLEINAHQDLNVGDSVEFSSTT